MNLTIVKSILGRKFRGSSLDDVQGISDFSLFGEAATNLLTQLDPLETVRHGIINFYDGILDYGLSSAAPDLKGKKIIDIRPQIGRNQYDNSSQTFIEDLDRDRNEKNFSIEFDSGTKFLRYVRSIGNSITVDDVSDASDWIASGGAANIAVDTLLFSEGGGSLRFDVGATGGIVTNSSLTAVDVSTHESKSSFFRYIYFPDSSIVTSVTIRIGSDASNYFSITGSIHLGSLRTGWNLYRFDWNGATETGTADTSSIDYEQVILVTTSADTDIRIGRLSSKLPLPGELVYYSNCLFRPLSGSTTWLTQPTNETDILNLEPEYTDIYINECCVLISSDLQHYDDMLKFKSVLYGDKTDPGLYSKYKSDKPGEAMYSQSAYYRVNRIRK